MGEIRKIVNGNLIISLDNQIYNEIIKIAKREFKKERKTNSRKGLMKFNAKMEETGDKEYPYYGSVTISVEKAEG